MVVDKGLLGGGGTCGDLGCEECPASFKLGFGAAEHIDLRWGGMVLAVVMVLIVVVVI